MTQTDKIIKQKDEQIATLKQEVRGYKKLIKNWDDRYQSVIKELRKINADLIAHAPKIVLLYLLGKYKKIKSKV